MFKPKQLKTIIKERIASEYNKHSEYNTAFIDDDAWIEYASSKIISTMQDRIEELKLDLNEKQCPYIDLVFNYLLNGE